MEFGHVFAAEAGQWKGKAKKWPRHMKINIKMHCRDADDITADLRVD